MHTAESSNYKNIYVDFENKRFVVLRSTQGEALTKLYYSAMAQLPNGGYIIAGGISKDSIVNYNGLFYFNPRINFYTKLAEIPFNIYKHEMYYIDGEILIFGGIDHKDVKHVVATEIGNLSSTLYRFSLVTRKWSKGEKMVTNFNEKCYSVYFEGSLIVARGGEVLSVYNKQ